MAEAQEYTTGTTPLSAPPVELDEDGVALAPGAAKKLAGTRKTEAAEQGGLVGLVKAFLSALGFGPPEEPAKPEDKPGNTQVSADAPSGATGNLKTAEDQRDTLLAENNPGTGSGVRAAAGPATVADAVPPPPANTMDALKGRLDALGLGVGAVPVPGPNRSQPVPQPVPGFHGGPTVPSAFGGPVAGGGAAGVFPPAGQAANTGASGKFNNVRGGDFNDPAVRQKITEWHKAHVKPYGQLHSSKNPLEWASNLTMLNELADPTKAQTLKAANENTYNLTTSYLANEVGVRNVPGQPQSQGTAQSANTSRTSQRTAVPDDDIMVADAGTPPPAPSAGLAGVRERLRTNDGIVNPRGSGSMTLAERQTAAGRWNKYTPEQLVHEQSGVATIVAPQGARDISFRTGADGNTYAVFSTQHANARFEITPESGRLADLEKTNPDAAKQAHAAKGQGMDIWVNVSELAQNNKLVRLDLSLTDKRNKVTLRTHTDTDVPKNVGLSGAEGFAKRSGANLELENFSSSQLTQMKKNSATVMDAGTQAAGASKNKEETQPVSFPGRARNVLPKVIDAGLANIFSKAHTKASQYEEREAARAAMHEQAKEMAREQRFQDDVARHQMRQERMLMRRAALRQHGQNMANYAAANGLPFDSSAAMPSGAPMVPNGNSGRGQAPGFSSPGG